MSTKFKYITFDEKGNEKRWIAKLKNEFPENFSNKRWIETVWTLFENDAEKWADTNDDVKDIVTKKNFIATDKIEFIRLIEYEYPDKNKENTTKTEREHDYNLKLQSIQQEKNETLRNYYKRTTELFKKLDDKDVPTVKSLNILKFSFLKNTIAYYIKNIRDEKLQTEVYVKHDESTEIRSLYGVCTSAEEILRTQKRQKKYQTKKAEKKRNEKLILLDKKLMTIKAGNFNSNTSIQVLQSQMTTLSYVIEFIFPNNRSSNSRRIRNSDRIQNVTNDSAANSMIRHQQKFFSQDSRFEQEHSQLSPFASITNTYQSRKWTDEQRAQKDRDFETNKHQHSNPLFNETQIYNKEEHDHWCSKCDLFDHHGDQCNCPTHQQITHAERRFIWKTTNYNSSTSRNAFRKIYTIFATSQVAYNSAASETTKYRAWPSANNENMIQSSPQPAMSQITYYNEIYDRDFFSETATSASASTAPLKHIDRMFQFKQCRTEHEPSCSSLKYAPEMSDSEYLSEMPDYDDSEVKILTPREINKINFVTLSHEKSDDSIVLLNVMKARKRQKKNNNNSDTDENIQQKRIADPPVDRLKKKEVKQKKIKKMMKSISRMKKKPEINVKNILMNNMITLPAMHLYQLSSHFRDETKRLIIVSRKSRTKKATITQTADTQIANTNLVEIDDSKNNKWITKKYLRTINESFNVFYVFTSCNKSDKKNSLVIGIPFGMAKADQKSDLIIINQELMNDLDLKMYPATKIDPRDIRMIVTNDNHHKLHYFVIFHVHVESITRKIWAFVNSNHNRIQLLLKLPWLHSVSAMMNIQKKKIIIDDKTTNKTTKLISAPKLIEKHMKNFPNHAEKQHLKTAKKKIIKNIIKRLKIIVQRVRNMNTDEKLDSNEYDASKSNTEKKITESNDYESFQ